MSADCALRQRDELRLSESPLRGAPSENRGRSRRGHTMRIKKRMLIASYRRGLCTWADYWIKSVKSLLLRAVGTANVTVEELQTVLVGFEAVLNLRSLGALSQDPNDGKALTTAHFQRKRFF
ncbi:uncharacterized protein [Drosophila bipectinata]|uniref:uncharacterized protein n=1 Tax=Drosophila bipectinata TaxID=42026 RepID=UPI0038B371AA